MLPEALCSPCLYLYLSVSTPFILSPLFRSSNRVLPFVIFQYLSHALTMSPPGKKSKANRHGRKDDHLPGRFPTKKDSHSMVPYSLFAEQCEPRSINAGRTVEMVESVLQWFAPLLQAYHIVKFLFLDVPVFPFILSTIRSYVFEKPIEFNLALLCAVIDLPNYM